MILKVSSHKDFELIESLAKEIWTEHYTPIIGKEQIDYMLGKFNTAKYMFKQAEDSNCLYFLIKKDDEPIGYIAIELRESHLFLNKFYVKLSQRGKGAGKEAMNFIETQAKEKGLKKITLRVNKLNTSSITKYEKLGFSKTQSLVQDIGYGFVMDDYVMEKQLG